MLIKYGDAHACCCFHVLIDVAFDLVTNTYNSIVVIIIGHCRAGECRHRHQHCDQSANQYKTVSWQACLRLIVPYKTVS